MRLRCYASAGVFIAGFFISVVDCRAVVRDGIGQQLDLEEHEEAHWSGNAPLIFNSTSYSSPSTSILGRRQNTKIEWLRILPLGASIVAGKTSIPEDGFRKPLRDHLRSVGFKVNMVGYQFNTKGSMRDGQHEGHPGHRIDQITQNLDRSAGSKPNVYLINAGTNDCQQNYLKMEGATGRLDSLLKKAWDLSGEATIILSTLLPSSNEDSNPGSNERVNALNNEIRDLARRLKGAGRRIQLADMNDGFITQTDLVDGVHPNGLGYRKMAAVWLAAIKQAGYEKMLQNPGDNGTPDDAPANSCDKIPGYADGPHKTQKGYGFDDGPYVHKGTPMGPTSIESITFSGRDKGRANRVAFGQMVNKGGNPDPRGALDDLILWRRERESEFTIEAFVYLNNGDGTFDHALKIANPFQCASLDIRWIDMNGDFLDDYVCVRDDGHLSVAINSGLDEKGSPQFKGIVFDVPAHAGYEGKHVRLGDIDGDGRTDYCLIGDDGVTKCWRNGGLGESAAYWQDFGIVFTPKGKGDIRGTRFIDINGDGRSDWIWVGDSGETDIYTNMRGPRSVVPNWLHATASHGGMGKPGVRDYVHFARIYPKDTTGRRDYVWVEAKDAGAEQVDHYLHIWRNDGSGGTQHKSDWNRYCDVSGDGKDDYLQIRPNGDVEMWGNIANPPEWNIRNIVTNIGRVDPKFVHFADWDGDGKCDIIRVAPHDGTLTLILNTYDKAGGAITWGSPLSVPKGSFDCVKQRWSLGIFDVAVRFADLNGDGRADYICMDPDGRTEATLNLGGTGGYHTSHLKQIKFSENKDRADHRFADVNGDGRADFLWTDKWTGDVHVWYNEGVKYEGDREDLQGSIIEWTPKGKLYNGVDAGPNEYFMDYDGDGRADLLRVNPTDNSAEVWYNNCSGGGTGGDDDKMEPSLPSYKTVLTCKPRSLDLCTAIVGFCEKPDHHEPSDSPLSSHWAPPDRSIKLLRRGGHAPKEAQLGNNQLMRLFFLSYPGFSALMHLHRDFPNQVTRRIWRFIQRNCQSDDPVDSSGQMPVIDDPDTVYERPDDVNLQVEHILDRQIMQLWGADMGNARLRSGRTINLPAIPRNFLAKHGTWEQSFTALGLAPPVSPTAVHWNPEASAPLPNAPDIPSDRIMQCFGTDQNPYPLMLVDAEINGPKGKIFGLKQPVDKKIIEQRSRRALATLDEDDFHLLFDGVLAAFAVFDYINDPEATARFNQVRNNIRLQFGHIELVTGQQNLMAWWDAWSNDFFEEVGRTARTWVIEALEHAFRPFVELDEAGDRHPLHDETFALFERWIAERVPRMTLPGDNSMQNPESPGSPGSPDSSKKAIAARNNMKVTTG